MDQVKHPHDQLVKHLRGIRRVVINCDHGGFSLSDAAAARYCQLAGIDYDDTFWDYSISRDDPCLVRVVEELGVEASAGKYATLKIIEIPADVEWQLEEYDGIEWIAEKHRTWR